MQTVRTTAARDSEARLKLLVLSSASSGGGAQRASRELTEALRQRGVDVTMLVGRRRPHDPSYVHDVRLGIENALARADRALRTQSDLRHLGSILRLTRIKPSDFDVVHMHNLRDARGGWISLRAARRLAQRVPTVWTFHDEWPVNPGLVTDLRRHFTPRDVPALGGDEPFFGDDPRALRRQRWLRRILPQPAAVVCPSSNLARLVGQSDLYAAVPVHHVPNGVAWLTWPETELPRDQARRALGIPREARVVLLAAANLEAPLKGTGLALDVLARLRAPKVWLLAVGDGAPRIRALAPVPATSLNYLNDDKTLASAYRAADLTLIPSLAENFPYVALESLACQTPVAAFRVGGLPEIVGADQRGVLAAPFDTGELAAAVDGLLGDAPRRIAAGAAGRRWVEETCDPAQWLAAHLSIYRSAIEGFARRQLGRSGTVSANSGPTLWAEG